MRTGTWLSVAFAFAFVFAADCVAAPSAQAAGLRLCIAGATKADSKLAYGIAQYIKKRVPEFQVASEGERAACDIIATVAGEGVQPAGIHSVVVASVRTQAPLWAGQSMDPSLEGVAVELGNKVFEAFKEGSALRAEALAGRAGQPAAGAAAPEAEPSAPPPPARRKPLPKVQPAAEPAADASAAEASPSAPPPPAKRKVPAKARRQDIDSQL